MFLFPHSCKWGDKWQASEDIKQTRRGTEVSEF